MARPFIYNTPKELQKDIDKYFASCINEDGTFKRPVSITGLALALGCHRETLLNYQNRDEFSEVVKRAKLRVENFYEERLTFGNATGTIFALKNFDWKDKQETDTTLRGDPNNPVKIDITLTAEEAYKRLLHDK